MCDGRYTNASHSTGRWLKKTVVDSALASRPAEPCINYAKPPFLFPFVHFFRFPFLRTIRLGCSGTLESCISFSSSPSFVLPGKPWLWWLAIFLGWFYLHESVLLIISRARNRVSRDVVIWWLAILYWLALFHPLYGNQRSNGRWS